MCCETTTCQKPQELKGKPESCSAEQIKKCHGNQKNHRCATGGKGK